MTDDRELCECPRCGKNHCKLGNPPFAVAQAEQRIMAALEIAACHGTTDGAHHKMWTIDQIVRALTGDEYPEWIADFCSGDDGPETYSWDEGIAP